MCLKMVIYCSGMRVLMERVGSQEWDDLNIVEWGHTPLRTMIGQSIGRTYCRVNGASGAYWTHALRGKIQMKMCDA